MTRNTCSTFARTLPNRRLRVRCRAVSLRPDVIFSFTAHSTPAASAHALPGAAGIALVAIHRNVVIADQAFHHGHVVHTAAGHAHRVHKPAAGIDTDVRLHA